MELQKINIQICFTNKTAAVEFVTETLPYLGISSVSTMTTRRDGSGVYCVSSVIDMSLVNIEMLHYLKRQLNISEVTQIYMFLDESEERD